MKKELFAEIIKIELPSTMVLHALARKTETLTFYVEKENMFSAEEAHNAVDIVNHRLNVVYSKLNLSGLSSYTSFSYNKKLKSIIIKINLG